MRKFLIYFPIIFLAVVLQTSSIPVIFDYIWLPDIILMMILAWALIDGFEKFLPWAVLAGILYDLSSFSGVGMGVIIFSLAAYGVGFFSKRFSVDMRGSGFLLSIFFVFSATIGSRIITSFSWVIKIFSEGGLGTFGFFGKNFTTAFLWNLMFFFAWFFIINRVENFFYLKRKDKIIV